MPNMRTRKLPIALILAHNPAMPAHPHRTSAAVASWLMLVIGLGAWSAHFFYNGGKALADVARNKPINAPLDWLAGVCARYPFADFHRAAILLVATLAALPFLSVLLRKPDGLLASELAALRHDRTGFRKAALAMPLCLAFSLSITSLTHGWSAIRIPENIILWLLGCSLASVFAELLFRGVLLRAFAGSTSTPAATAVSAALYAVFCSALFPPGIHSWEPALSSVRFPLARSLTTGLFSPAYVSGLLIPLFIVGLSLGWARSRLASAWPMIGIHFAMLLAWQLTHQPMSALLATILTIYVHFGHPSFRTTASS